MTDAALLSSLVDARGRFLELVAALRPELHRYCTRMTGSVFDGEDVLQEALAKACFALGELEAVPPLRPWLFRIAHHTALDFLKRAEHQRVDLMDELEVPQDVEIEVDGQRLEAAYVTFAALPALQRSALAFKDVLGLSLEETAAAMDTTVLAVKSALTRARANVARHTRANVAPAADLERVRRYVALFNAKDWDGLRQLFTDETKLDVVSLLKRSGPASREYFSRYEALAEDLRAVAGTVEGVQVIAVYRPSTATRPAFFIRVEWAGERVTSVRDYRRVPYLTAEAEFVP